jgi:hypothetical protein
MQVTTATVFARPARENVLGDNICGHRLKRQWATSLWKHVEAFHPQTHKILKDDKSPVEGSTGARTVSRAADRAVTATSSRSSADATLASSTQLACTAQVSYQQMVDAFEPCAANDIVSYH